MPDRKSRVRGTKSPRSVRVRGTKRRKARVSPQTRSLESAPNEVPLSEQIDVVDQARRNIESSAVAPVVPLDTSARSGARLPDTTTNDPELQFLMNEEVDFRQSVDDNIRRIMDERFAREDTQQEAPRTRRRKSRKVRRTRSN